MIGDRSLRILTTIQRLPLASKSPLLFINNAKLWDCGMVVESEDPVCEPSVDSIGDLFSRIPLVLFSIYSKVDHRVNSDRAYLASMASSRPNALALRAWCAATIIPSPAVPVGVPVVSEVVVPSHSSAHALRARQVSSSSSAATAGLIGGPVLDSSEGHTAEDKLTPLSHKRKWVDEGCSSLE